MEADGFCKGCGLYNALDPGKEEPPEPQEAGTQPGTEPGFTTFELGEQPPPEEEVPVLVPRAEIVCPSCGSSNSDKNRHCEECGARLSQGPLPVAPRPAVQATAGVRALLAISAIILTVVLIAVVFNLITDDTPIATSTTSTVATTTTTLPPEPIEILTVDCTPPGLASFRCENLINDREGEWQINWETLEPDQEVTIKFIFQQAINVRGIIWKNLTDGDRFYQNHRARAVSVTYAGGVPYPLNLEDEPGSQNLAYGALRTNDLTVTITDTYPAQIRNNRIFTELAIEGITIIGRPAALPTTSTSTTTEES